MPATQPGTPAQWLIAEYESVDMDDFRDPCDPCDPGDPLPGPDGSVYVQPIFTIRDDTGTYCPMDVTSGDYTDSGRWWL